jgi:hypothetical protein
VIKNCRTCGHRRGSVEFGQCDLTGYYCQTQRRYPGPPCDINLSGWVPREPTLWERIMRRLFP